MNDLTHNIKKLTGIILFPVAVLLAFILFPISFVIGIIMEEANKYLFRIAYGIDVLGNAVCGPLFNLTLIKNNNPYKFGSAMETISYVIAVNKSRNNLSNTGKAVAWILDTIDPGHTDLKEQEKITRKAVNDEI